MPCHFPNRPTALALLVFVTTFAAAQPLPAQEEAAAAKDPALQQDYVNFYAAPTKATSSHKRAQPIAKIELVRHESDESTQSPTSCHRAAVQMHLYQNLKLTDP